MDKRGTLSASENFMEKLQSCYHNKEKVSMILDDGGLQRAEGIIKNINSVAQPPYLQLQDGTKIDIHSIVAINGTFLSDYAEC